MIKPIHALDYIVMVAYILLMLAVGYYYSRKVKTREDYHLGGRKMKPWAVGLSLFATLLSAISYLAVPGEVIQHGPTVAITILALPVTVSVVTYLLIPCFMKLNVTSAYELLETRLGYSIRFMGSVIFVLTRLSWMALIIYLSAVKILIPVMGWPESYAPYVCFAIGLLTVIYTSIGGLQAVVWTDVLQTFILLGAALWVISLITYRMGGITAWIPTSWQPNWDHQPLVSLSPYVRVTVLGMLISDFTWWVCTAGSDQMAIQRYLATRDVRAARRTFLTSMLTNSATTIFLALLGFSLLAYFSAHPELLPAGLSLSKNGDQVFPYFIQSMLPIGGTGLVISGLMAASMSSLSSGVSSVSVVVIEDFLRRFSRKNRAAQSETAFHRSQVRQAQWISFVIGLAVVLLSMLMAKVPGNILEVTNKTNGLFVAPLFGLFFMALFVPFATSFGTFWGSVYGFSAAAIVAYWDLLTGKPSLSFQWILPVSLLVNIAAGILFSLWPRKAAKSPQFIIAHILALLLLAGIAIALICET